MGVAGQENSLVGGKQHDVPQGPPLQPAEPLQRGPRGLRAAHAQGAHGQVPQPSRGVFWLAPTATTMIMVPATLAALKGLVRPLQPDRGVLAASSVEIDLSSVPEGECVTFKFREKPLFIRHRSEDQMANSDSLDISTLRDPQGVKEHCRADPKWFIALAVCTHLGCVPIPDVGNHANGGYFCPCHGSHYDELGRIRAGPAPLNLEVPEYQFLDENLVKVG